MNTRLSNFLVVLCMVTLNAVAADKQIFQFGKASSIDEVETKTNTVMIVVPTNGTPVNIDLKDFRRWMTNGLATSNMVFTASNTLGVIIADVVNPDYVNVNWRGAIFVSAANGLDSTALRENPSHPFGTLTSALTNSISGDTVVVYDGSFSESLTVTNGASFLLQPGVTMSGAITLHGEISTLYMRGEGALTGSVVTPSNGMHSVVLDASRVAATFTGAFSNITIRSDSSTLLTTRASGSAYKLKVSPLTLPLAVATYTSDGLANFVEVYDCTTTNVSAFIGGIGGLSIFQGSFDSGGIFEDVTVRLNNTRLYSTDATIEGSYYTW